jgi:hypothetical protein
LTTKGNSKQNKRAKTKADSNRVSVKSEESTGSKPSALKCKVYDGNHATKDCYYTSKNPPPRWSGKPEIWRKIIETHQTHLKQD